MKQRCALAASPRPHPCRLVERAESTKDWLLPRVMELTYTAWDLEGFAKDCLGEANSEWRTANGAEGFGAYWRQYSPHSPVAVHHSPPPFRWDEARRFLLRCELDAAYFHLYPDIGCRGADAAYILDTFPIVKRKDEQQYGTYRTRDQILAIYDAVQQAMSMGQPYQTLLDPPPADPRVAHPPRVATA